MGFCFTRFEAEAVASTVSTLQRNIAATVIFSAVTSTTNILWWVGQRTT